MEAIAVTLIETRGDGGLFLCAPSRGYTMLAGDLAELSLRAAARRDVRDRRGIRAVTGGFSETTGWLAINCLFLRLSHPAVHCYSAGR